MLKLLSKIPAWVYFVLAFAGYVTYSNHRTQELRVEIAELRFSKDSTVQLQDSLFVRLATTELDKETLSAALQAAKATNARLIAAAVIRIVPNAAVGTDVVATADTVYADKTRVATFNDTTETGVLDATVTAPPYPESLLLTYKYAVAPITPTISLLRTDANSVVFAVSYAGGTTEITAPYTKLPEDQPKVLWTLGAYKDLATDWFVQAGVRLKLPFVTRLYAQGSIEQYLVANSSTRFAVGVVKEFKW